MNALAFTHRYRNEVVGLVLIDTSHPQQLRRLNRVLPRRAPNDNSPLPREWQSAVESLHRELQRELAGTSSNSKHIVASKAGHNIQLEPQLVLDAILELVTEARL